MTSKIFLLQIIRLTLILLYSILVKDLNILFLFFILEGVSILLLKNNQDIFLINILLLIFILSSFSIDLYRDFNGGIGKSGNELAFYEIIIQLSKEDFSLRNIIEFYILYEDILFITLNLIFFKLLHLNDFINIVILNNYLASWSILFIWKTFKISSKKVAIISSIGILLFYASSGLRDILGLFLFTFSFYIFKTRISYKKYFIILFFVLLQYFIRPLNSFLTLSFILSVFIFDNYQIKNKKLILYFIFIIFFAKLLLNLQFMSFAEDLYAWNQSHSENILTKSNNSFLANLRFNNIGFIIPLLLTIFGENILIFFKFSSFNIEYVILSITSLYTLYVLFLFIKFLLKTTKSSINNTLFIICSFHSMIIFFLSDETRHRLFFLLIISFILLINHFNENSSSS